MVSKFIYVAELNALITLENMQLPCQNLVALRDPKKVVNLVRGYQCLALLILSIDFISRLFVVVKTFKRTLIKKMSILNS